MVYSGNARVCQEWFPKGSYKGQKADGFLMSDMLKEQIDILAKNVTKDWDFTIIISGSGEVRVGKSVLALQIASYWHYLMWKLHGKKIPFTVENNIIFDGRKLIEKGNFLGQNFPFSALDFDEAGADLEGRKTMQSMTQDVLDYYRECGQYNMLNILVIPEYFDLPKPIAVSRSICLLNVYYSFDENDYFRRGYFDFYSRRGKKILYQKGKRDLNYSVQKGDFSGTFPNFYPIDEQEYRNSKVEAMKKRESKRRGKFQTQRDACWYILNQELGWTQMQITKKMESLTGIYVDRTLVSDGVRHFMTDEELKATERSN